jgi:phospholipid-binding lipoprotein MlaA
LDDAISHAYDPYAFVRDAYLQRRAYLVSDGKVNVEPLEDPGEDAKGTALPPTSPPPAAPPVPPTPPAP